MNKLIKIPFILIYIVGFISCGENKVEKKEVVNSEQSVFNKFIITNCEGFRANKNDIQKDEYISQYKDGIRKLSDSIMVVKNWEGRITKIGTSNWDAFGQIEINVEIESELSDYQKITYKTTRYFSKNNIDSNLLYRELKELKEGQSIYFSGVFEKDKEDKIEFDDSFPISDYSKSELVCSPKIFFHLATVTLNPLKFAETESFKICSEQLYQSWELMKGSIKGKYSKSQLSEGLNKTAKKVKPYSLKFTKEEKDYYQSLTDCLKLNFDKIK